MLWCFRLSTIARKRFVTSGFRTAAFLIAISQEIVDYSDPTKSVRALPLSNGYCLTLLAEPSFARRSRLELLHNSDSKAACEAV
jgi:hypothetical protein